MKVLHEKVENNNRITYFTQDGHSISHTVIEPLQDIEIVPSLPPTTTTLEERVENVENTLNFILLGGI